MRTVLYYKGTRSRSNELIAELATPIFADLKSDSACISAIAYLIPNVSPESTLVKSGENETLRQPQLYSSRDSSLRIRTLRVHSPLEWAQPNRISTNETRSRQKFRKLIRVGAMPSEVSSRCLTES